MYGKSQLIDRKSDELMRRFSQMTVGRKLNHLTGDEYDQLTRQVNYANTAEEIARINKYLNEFDVQISPEEIDSLITRADISLRNGLFTNLESAHNFWSRILILKSTQNKHLYQLLLNLLDVLEKQIPEEA